MMNRVLRAIVCLVVTCMLIASPSDSQSRKHARPAVQGSSRPALRPLTAEQRLSLAKTDTAGLPWFDDVEKGPGQWSATGMWHVALQPQRVSVLNPTIFPYLVLYPDSGFLPSAFSGNAAWWFGEEATGTFIGDDFDRAQEPLSGGYSTRIISGDLITPPINLAGQKNALLTFMTWWEVEGVAADAFDLMSLSVSNDGGVTWFVLGRGLLNPLNNQNGASYKSFSSDGLGKRARWTQQQFDLTEYVGQVIQIRFNFDTGDEEFNGFRGWFIDDINVTGSSVGAPSITSVTPHYVAPNEILTINGANFDNGARVDVDSAQVISAVMSSTTATFFAPSQPGSYSVQVTNPNGLGVSAIRAFIVSGNTAPSISSIQPDSARVGVSVSFTISGSGFQPGLTVDFGGVPVPPTAIIVDTLFGTITGTTPLLPVGYYNVRVVNPDSLRDELILGFNVYSPQIVVSSTGDSLTITPPSGLLFNTGKLYFRKGGTIAYDSLSLSVLTGAFTTGIPSAAKTIRGLQFYVALQNSLGARMTYPAVNPEANPAQLPLKFSSIPALLSLSPFKFRMVSVPGLLDSALISAQLADDFGPYDPLRWRLFRWKTDRYIELPEFSTPTVPGDAYWLVTAGDASFDLKNITTTPTTMFPVAIDTGWTQIGDPFGFPVAWPSVISGSNQAIIGPYGYDGTQYSIDQVMVPYSGYFVYNPNPFPEVLIFQPIDASLFILGKSTVAVASLAPGEFVLHLAAEVPGTDNRDTHNALGLKRGSTAGTDALDAPKPPPIGSGVRLNVLEGGTSYLENYKPWNGEGQSWVFAVVTSGLRGKVSVTLTADGTLPAGSELHVLDLENENAVPLPNSTFEVELPASDAPHRFKVIIGTASYVEKERQGISLVPLTYSLDQNFPNPFNPETMIRYTLAGKSDVTLEIYNALGQRMRTLVNGTEGTGLHEVVWNGTNESGGQTASGVYFCRLRAGSFMAVRKLLLVR